MTDRADSTKKASQSWLQIGVVSALLAVGGAAVALWLGSVSLWSPPVSVGFVAGGALGLGFIGILIAAGEYNDRN